jgi:hypothetical protein
MKDNKIYLVEWVDPRTQTYREQKIKAQDKTEARDSFFEEHPEVQLIDRITWIPNVA